MLKTELPAETKLALAGEICIRRIGELKDRLQQAIAQSAAVRVDLSRVEKIDLCALQLFCSAHRTAVEANCSLRLLEPLPDSVREVVAEAGLASCPNCVGDDKGQCLWVTGSKDSL